MVSHGVGCGARGGAALCTLMSSMIDRFCETCVSSVPLSKIMFSVVMIYYLPHCSVCVYGSGYAHTHARTYARSHTRALAGWLADSTRPVRRDFGGGLWKSVHSYIHI